jgi:hypothetical protein
MLVDIGDAAAPDTAWRLLEAALRWLKILNLKLANQSENFT